MMLAWKDVSQEEEEYRTWMGETYFCGAMVQDRHWMGEPSHCLVLVEGTLLLEAHMMLPWMGVGAGGIPWMEVHM